MISPKKKIFKGPGDSDGSAGTLDWVVRSASLTQMVTFELSLREESRSTYLKYLKDNKLVNVAKKRQTHRQIKLGVTGGERQYTLLGEWAGQTIIYKISYKGTLYSTEYSQYFIVTLKWSTIFKKVFFFVFSPIASCLIHYRSSVNICWQPECPLWTLLAESELQILIAL